MADRTVYHVEPHEEGWAVTKEGATRASTVEDTKTGAVDAARGYAQKQTPSQVVVHKKDGSVQKAYSYPPEGETEKNGAAGSKLALPEIDKEAFVQELKVRGDQLVDQVRTLVEEGNARRVIIKKDGRTVMELPLSVGVGGAAAALLISPVLAALGALGALVSDVDIVVERTVKKK